MRIDKFFSIPKEPRFHLPSAVGIFVLVAIFYHTAEFVMESLPSQIVESTQAAAKDIEFNDIYYFTRKQYKKPDVVLVNIGSIGAENIRPQLIESIKTVKACGAKAVGLDILFTDSKNPIDDITLRKLIRKERVIIGMSHEDTSIFYTRKSDLAYHGYINLPHSERETVRNYYTKYDLGNITLESFGRKLFREVRHEDMKLADNETVKIKYTSVEKGYYNYFIDGENAADENHYNFPAIEAYDLALQDKADLKELFNGKVVIFGLIGKGEMDNRYDIEDKHRVPTDFSLFNRSPIMPGCVIHANAVQMMLDGKYLEEGNSTSAKAVVYFLAFLYLLVCLGIEHNERFKPLELSIAKFIAFAITLLFVIQICGVWLMRAGYYFDISLLLKLIAATEIFYGTAEGTLYFLCHRKKHEKIIKYKKTA